jgi:GPI mannosyltransferase 3
VSSSETAPFHTFAVSSRVSLAAFALPMLLLAAFAIRAAVVLTQTYVIYVDETFQYFEQGHRLAFGSGLLPWEFQDGARSWLLPGLIAGVMRLVGLLSDNPLVHVRLIRLLCVSLSLAVVLVGFRAAERRDGLVGAVVTGGFCAIWFDLIYFSPAVLTEVLAAHCALLAICLGERTLPHPHRRLALIGALYGISFCLRYQYAPALLIAVLWQHGASWQSWRWLLLGGLAVVVPAAGVLDALTWGMPFQSIWLNVWRNSAQGVSTGMGVESPAFYVAYLGVSLWPVPLLGALAVLGAIRMPVLGLVAFVTILEHSLLPHKEVRFIYLALAAAPILIGLSVSGFIQHLSARLGAWFAPLAVTAFLLASAGLSWWTATGALGPRWQFERANTQAFLAAHNEPGLCGLAVRDVWFWETGGYTYLHRDVPIWFADDTSALTLPGTDRALNLVVMHNGRTVPRIPAGEFAASTARFSHMIAQAGHTEPGYAPVACFNDAARAGAPDLCLFRRPGGCS